MRPEPVRFRSRYDAVVIGARCAGAATAMLLARAGLSVLLVDRDRYGADTLSTLALMRAGVLQLHRWGLLEALRDSGVPAITSTSFAYETDTTTIPIRPRDGVDALYAPRRTVLDALLADAAAEAGADVAYGPRLIDVRRDPSGRVVGAILEDRQGGRQRVRAGIVIGADGLRSTVARSVDAQAYRQGRHACGVAYTFWSGLERNRSRWYYGLDAAAGAIPTHDGQACVFAAVPPGQFGSRLQRDLRDGYLRVLEEAAPELAGETAGRAPSERVRGFPGHPGVMRQSHGPGWALVGDAGYFKDPITAHGISDALRDAELLARAVVRGTARALADYQATRDELSEDLFEITDAIAGFGWDLERLQQLHLDLSKTMNREVEALLGLDTAAVAGPAGTESPAAWREPRSERVI